MARTNGNQGNPLEGIENIYTPDHVRMGVYANITNLNVTDNEVTLIFLHRDRDSITSVSKVTISRKHAKSLSEAIEKSLKSIIGVEKPKK